MNTPPRNRVVARASIETASLRSLVAAADGGSLSAAARAVGAQLSTVSRQVAELERSLGVALLVRTGRGVRLTPAGERYVERARRVLIELDAAEGEARGGAVTSAAAIRLAVPVELSLQLVPGVLVELSRRHPGVAVTVSAEARRVSLLEEDFDAAVRLGAPRDSQLVARPLGNALLVLAARPAFASRLATVAAVEAAEHVLVSGATAQLQGRLGRREVKIRRTGSLSVSTFSEAASIAWMSDRVALLPSFTAGEWIRSGRLARVLPELVLPPVPVHLLLAQRNRGEPVLRVVAELLSTALAQAERSVRRAS